MNVRLFLECIKLEAPFAQVRDCYNRSKLKSRTTTPPDLHGYPLESYGSTIVTCYGVLVTNGRYEQNMQELGKKYLKGCVIKEMDLPELEMNDVYFEPISITMKNRGCIWTRSGDDIAIIELE